ncbi:protein FAR-RED IMPAIRED RESPONSE 1-like [Chenopodium quinoa]|uniref:protein FAR-RED IMPAIRED RESPONSE 1-like n=1 Tax=Chenopodium quinoa TaxID=63459 RepID=UPI000B7754B1|nr:protein FAR-RED IMPAIRED RESPONSE 1-like [Chenopodium quinoa]XP_021740509.1 protein FAR-RED IMPAIRED RESPONSE 1-like [Chenopodium quinoa]XP_021740583.1 protein FAR-RED IMPAIRED RESPONSE 1-like [Chenopodium quinoa]
MMYCYPREENKATDTILQYLIDDRVWVVPEGRSEEILTDKRRFYSATFDTESKVVCCDCRKFETSGIMCKHIMRILDLNLVSEIPERYIINQWRKDILRRHTRVKVSYHDPENTSVGKRYSSLMSSFEPICEEAAMVNDKTVNMVINCLQQVKSDVMQSRKRKYEDSAPVSYADEGPDPFEDASCEVNGTESTVQQPSATGMGGVDAFEPVETEAPVVMKDPLPKKRDRGRPKGSRNKTLAEMGYKKTSKNNGQVMKAVDKANEAVESATQAVPTPKKMTVRRPPANAAPTDGDADVAIVPEDDVLVIGTSTCGSF